jgi:hypothetical protein
LLRLQLVAAGGESKVGKVGARIRAFQVFAGNRMLARSAITAAVRLGAQPADSWETERLSIDQDSASRQPC